MTHLLAAVFDMVIGCAMLLFFLRFMFEFANINKTDPLAKPIFRLTRIVDLFGRILPTIGQKRINTAALLLLLLLRLIFLWGVLQLMHQDSQNLGLFFVPAFNHDLIDHLARHYSPFLLFFTAAISLVLDFLRMAQYIIIGSFIVSWIVIFTQNAPPVLGLITRLSEPFIEPFRKVIPPMGMFDLAPTIGFFAIILAEMVIQTLTVYLLTL